MLRPALLALAALAAAANAVTAHPLAPALLEVRAAAGGRADVAWKTPRLRARGAHVAPVLPARCRPVAPAVTETDETSVRRRWTVDCGPEGLVGARLGVAGLETAGSAGLVRVVLHDGRVVRSVVTARDPWVVVPARPPRLGVVRDYVALGVEHILAGPDHLLFVLGLCLLARGGRRLLGTVTAFTLGHSVTLSLVVLDLVRVPAGPVELAIALSVYALAVELARRPRRATLLRRAPWAMAAAFGLLHGLGFAAALRAVGLPAGEVPAALAAFNGGIELGQVAVVVGLLALRAALEWLPIAWPAWTRALPVYGMGALAGLWCIERAMALLA